MKKTYKELSKAIDTSEDVHRHDEAPNRSHFNSTDKVEAHINAALPDDQVDSIKAIEIGEYFPYNPSNPYGHDTYEVTLNSGTKFNVVRWYGRPNWSGNVVFCNTIEVSYFT